MAAAESPTAAEQHPQLAAVVADDPAALLRAISSSKASSKAGDAPCGLSACHLAAALGRRRCLVALLDAGEALPTKPASCHEWLQGGKAHGEEVVVSRTQQSMCNATRRAAPTWAPASMPCRVPFYRRRGPVCVDHPSLWDGPFPAGG